METTAELLEVYKQTDFQLLAPETQKTLLKCLLEMYEAGKTINEIADNLNKSSATIHRLLRKVPGYKARPATHKPKGEKIDIIKMQKFYADGWSVNQIAKHFNVSPSVISRCLLEQTPQHENKEDKEVLNSNLTVFICPYCWSISGACCPNDNYLELSGYIYKIFLESDNETRKQIIESEQNKKYQSLKEQSNIIRLLGR